MLKTITAFQAAIATTVSIRTNQYLLTIAKLDPLPALLLAGTSSVIVALLLDYLFTELPKRSELVRKWIDPRHKYEGAWIITLDGVTSRPYSYAKIAYNQLDSKYTYNGTSFSADGKIGSTWNSSELTFNHSANQIRFFAEAQLADSAGESLKNWGHISFEKDTSGKKFTRGKGFFVDIGTQLMKAHFYLDRLSPTEIKALIKRESIESHDDMAELIRAYHQKRQTNGSAFPALIAYKA